MSPLRRRMVEDMTIRNLSPATQRSYIHAVKRYSLYFGRSPDLLGLEDVRTYQVHLAAKGIAWPTLNQIVCALRFFYGVTLGQDEVPERIPYARHRQGLPEILSRDEVVRFLEAVSSLKCRVALTTAYATGLRVSEVVGVEVRNIDSGRMVIRVENGKGGCAQVASCGSAPLMRSLRDAVGAAAWHFAWLLEAHTAATVSLPWPRSGHGRQRHGAPRGMPLGLRGGGHRQEGQRPYA